MSSLKSKSAVVAIKVPSKLEKAMKNHVSLKPAIGQKKKSITPIKAPKANFTVVPKVAKAIVAEQKKSISGEMNLFCAKLVLQGKFTDKEIMEKATKCFVEFPTYRTSLSGIYYDLNHGRAYQEEVVAANVKLPISPLVRDSAGKLVAKTKNERKSTIPIKAKAKLTLKKVAEALA